VKGARVATKDCSLVFVDPDNGLEVPSTKIHHTKAPKFAFFDELTAFTGRRQSLVIYHHLNRTRKAQREFALRFDQIQKHFPDAQAPFGLWYHRGPARVFFIVPAKGHSARLRERAETLSGGAWGEHFERV
jgi:hypothetical protein